MKNSNLKKDMKKAQWGIGAAQPYCLPHET